MLVLASVQVCMCARAGCKGHVIRTVYHIFTTPRHSSNRLLAVPVVQDPKMRYGNIDISDSMRKDKHVSQQPTSTSIEKDRTMISDKTQQNPLTSTQQ